MKIKGITIYLIVFILFILSDFLLARENEEEEDQTRFMMEEVVVTATRTEEELKKIPANVTVITREDIEQSTSTNIIDILAREGGLVQRNFMGHDKKAAVDIRGMGETSVSAVLVTVDGIRINPSDMAGPDLSTITLDQVERIEILHGAGSVLYGDGAVGGVINIITKKPGGKPRGSIKTEGGSYQTTNSALSLAGSYKNFGYSLVANYNDTDGYREMGYLRNKNLTVKLVYDINDRLTIEGNFISHRDRYGFPGPLNHYRYHQNPQADNGPHRQLRGHR